MILLPFFLRVVFCPFYGVTAYRTFDRITRVNQGAIAENKRLSEALEMCRAMQAELPPKLRSRKAPARTAQPGHMFGVG